jgi:uncharacterized protein (TIGR03790 family)
MKNRSILALFFLLFSAIPITALTSTPPIDNVLVVINDASPASVDVGLYYARVRNVSMSCILHMKFSNATAVQFSELKETILPAIKKGIKGSTSYIVMTYDTPYKFIVKEGAKGTKIVEYSLDAFLCYPDDKYEEGKLPDNYTGVDNVFYKKTDRYKGGDSKYFVTRIDGPSPQAAKELVDRAASGEIYINNKFGKCYLDSKGAKAESKDKASSFAADTGLREAEKLLKGAGYNVTLEDTSAGFEAGKCVDALFYFGWGGSKDYTPDVFTWMPGAIGVTINPDSALNLRREQTWLGGAIKNGITASIGTIGETNSSSFNPADLFLKYITAGYNLAEAAYYSSPFAKYAMVVIGDPLYTPCSPAITKKTETTPPVFLRAEYLPDDDRPRTEGGVLVLMDRACSVKFEYGETQEYGTVADSPTLKTRHLFPMKNLKPGTPYYFRIKVVDPFKNATSKESKFYSPKYTPGPVAGLSVEEKKGAVSLTWNRSEEEDVTGYKLYRKAAGDEDFELIASFPQSSTTYSDTKVKNDIEYLYMIKTCNKDNELSPKKTARASPTELLAVERLQGEVKTGGIGLSWNVLDSKEVGGYQVLRKQSKENTFKKLKFVLGGSYTDTDVKPGTVYYYKIKTMGKTGVEGKETLQIKVTFKKIDK